MWVVFAIAAALIGAPAGLIVVKDDDHWRDGDPRHASRGAFRGAVIALVVCCLAIGVLICGAVSAHARPSPYPPPDRFNGDRYEAQTHLGPEVVRAVKAKQGAKPRARYLYPTRKRPPVVRQKWRLGPVPAARPVLSGDYRAAAPLLVVEGNRREVAQVIGGRPAGCPYRFCGCGASIHLFGRIIPALNLAANWLRFPRAAPAPDMVAAHRGHVFVLKRHIAGNMWLVHDSNSGRGRTRVHPRSIAGYQIVNPHGGTS